MINTKVRCTNGKVYLQLIFSEDGTDSYNMFGCNVQIYGYSTKPESWGNDEDESEPEKDSQKTTTDSSKKSDKAETTVAVSE